MVLGIVSLVTCWLWGLGIILGALALVFGIIGRKRVQRGESSNGAFATAGIVTGSVGIVLGAVILGAMIWAIVQEENRNRAGRPVPDGSGRRGGAALEAASAQRRRVRRRGGPDGTPTGAAPLWGGSGGVLCAGVRRNKTAAAVRWRTAAGGPAGVRRGAAAGGGAVATGRGARTGTAGTRRPASGREREGLDVAPGR